MYHSLTLNYSILIRLFLCLLISLSLQSSGKILAKDREHNIESIGNSLKSKFKKKAKDFYEEYLMEEEEKEELPLLKILLGASCIVVVSVLLYLAVVPRKKEHSDNIDIKNIDIDKLNVDYL